MMSRDNDCNVVERPHSSLPVCNSRRVVDGDNFDNDNDGDDEDNDCNVVERPHLTTRVQSHAEDALK